MRAREELRDELLVELARTSAWTYDSIKSGKLQDIPRMVKLADELENRIEAKMSIYKIVWVQANKNCAAFCDGTSTMSLYSALKAYGATHIHVYLDGIEYDPEKGLLYEKAD